MLRLLAIPVVAALAAPAAAPSVYDFQVKAIDGKPKSLADYQGRVLLVVNTASRCGLTPQYEGLEKLHETYAAKGLAILAFPSNDFLGQEPGSNAEIQQFCSSTFGVKFDMFEKVQVKGGAGQAPLYAFLTERANPALTGPIRWNFDKFLVDRSGHVVARFEPRTTPQDPALIKRLEAELAKK